MNPTSILTESELLETIARERAANRTVAFANGCFDVLHVGHIRYLTDAASRADLLVVGVNGDKSVRALKGEGRPIMPERERAEIVAALRGVAYVVIFQDLSPRELLRKLRPDFHCKGTDYSEDSVPERDVVTAYGGKVVITGDPKDHSTTELIEQMRRLRP